MSEELEPEGFALESPSVSSAWDDEDTPVGQAVFPGDVGQLPADVRALLVTLLKRRYLSAETSPKEWRLLLENESSLRTRLHDVFLELVVNREYEVAYKQQAVSETGERFPTLLHDLAYSREETIVLVVLRRLLRQRQQAGVEVAFVDRDELLDEISAYRPATNTDLAQDARSASNAIESVLKMDLLLKTPQAERYRIPTVLEVLLPVDKLREFLVWLEKENADEPSEAEDQPSESASVLEQSSLFDAANTSDHPAGSPPGADETNAADTEAADTDSEDAA